MTNEDAIKWLEKLKQDIGQLRHEDLWHYEQAIDEICSLLKEQEESQKFYAEKCDELYSVAKSRTEVVRCKECRWGDWSRNGKGEKMILCYNGDTGIEDGYLHEPNWYCADGERKKTK